MFFDSSPTMLDDEYEQSNDRHSPFLCCSSASTLCDPDVPSVTPAYAVVSGNLTQVRDLAATGAYTRPSDAWTIYEACTQGSLMIRALSANIAIDLNPVVLGQMGDRVFHFLLRTSPTRFFGGKLEIIKQLLKNGVDPLEPDRFGNTALHIIAEMPAYQESLQLMELLLGDEAPRVTRTSCLSNIDRRNGLYEVAEYGDTALHVAVLHNNEACTKLLLESGASPHITGLLNQTPLYLAAAGNCFGIVHLLLEHGATVEPDEVVSPEMRAELSLPKHQE
ncbi:hypothetical protein FPRO03_03452 [Fusarium proliferatum]|nr:hypothetical protein FPRO03_03452 [Fusarium proliferatum]